MGSAKVVRLESNCLDHSERSERSERCYYKSNASLTKSFTSKLDNDYYVNSQAALGFETGESPAFPFFPIDEIA